jgi:hypothetical protein
MTDIAKINGLPAPMLKEIELLIKKGFSPVAASGKAMKQKGWQNLDIGIDQIQEYFGPSDNVGIRMGSTAGGCYATVDFDCQEAHQFRNYLPDTEMWHGRENNPYSHATYTISNGESPKIRHFRDVDGSAILDFLGEKSAVLVPPSSHPDGDKYLFHGPLSPSEINLDDLLYSVKKVYLAALVLRHYPVEGSRQDFCLGIAGVLLKSGFDALEAQEMVADIAKAAADEEWEKRELCVVSSAKKFSTGESIAGASLLSGIVDDGFIKKLTGTLPSDGSSKDKIAEVVAELNLSHALAMIGGKAAILNEFVDPAFGYATFSLSSAGDFKLKYSNRRVRVSTKDDPAEFRTIADVWLGHPDRRQYEGLVFDPKSTPPGHYNLYRGFAIEPIHGDCGLYLAHIRNVICKEDEKLYDYLIHWMAHAVQRPWELPEVAIVVRGKQGTGKTTWVNYFGEIFGQHFITLYSMKQVTGQFNGHLADKILVCANEAIWGGDKPSEGYLKGLITDPTVPIEFKFKDLINVRNYKRLIVTTNEDWAVPIGVDDRRYVVLDISDCYKEDKKYFSAVNYQMESGGTAALMEYLLGLDLEGFQIRSAPYTASSFDIKLKSSDPIYAFLYEALSDQLPPDYDFEWVGKIPQYEFYRVYKSWCTDNKVHHPHTQRYFTVELKKILPGTLVKKATKVDPFGNRPREYRLPSVTESRSLFQAALKSGPEIWSEDEDQV